MKANLIHKIYDENILWRIYCIEIFTRCKLVPQQKSSWTQYLFILRIQVILTCDFGINNGNACRKISKLSRIHLKTWRDDQSKWIQLINLRELLLKSQ